MLERHVHLPAAAEPPGIKRLRHVHGGIEAAAQRVTSVPRHCEAVRRRHGQVQRVQAHTRQQYVPGIVQF